MHLNFELKIRSEPNMPAFNIEHKFGENNAGIIGYIYAYKHNKRIIGNIANEM